MPNEEETSQQLWQYIERRKHVEATLPVTASNPSMQELSELMALSDAMLEVLQEERKTANSQTVARARLLQAIQTEPPRAASPVAAHNGSRGRRRQILWNRQTVLVLVLLLLAGAALALGVWNSYQIYCTHPGASKNKKSSHTGVAVGRRNGCPPSCGPA